VVESFGAVKRTSSQDTTKMRDKSQLGLKSVRQILRSRENEA